MSETTTNQTIPSTKVCPNCGNEYFHVYETSSRIAILNGNRDFISYDTLPTVDELSSTMQCTQCNRNYTEDDLASETQFHEVIASEEYRSNIRTEVEDLTSEQRQLMWASHITLIEEIDTPVFGVIKDKYKNFGTTTLARSEKMLETDSKILVVYKDGSHKANFSL